MSRFVTFSVFLFLSVWGMAQYDTLQLNEVVVTAERSPATLMNTNRLVELLPARRIEWMPVTSVHDLLGSVPGVDVRQRGPEGVQADISIRGGTFDQTLVMIDGIKINDPQTGHHNFNLPVGLSSISRIEVMKGGASRVLGPDAFSGAVNIITRLPDSSFLEGILGAGQHGWLQAGVEGGIRSGRFRNLIQLQRSNSQGYRDNTDFGITRLFYRGRYQGNHATVDMLVGWLDKGFGANGFYTPAFPDQYEHFRTGLTAVRVTTGEKIRYEQSVYWRRSYDQFKLFRHDPPAWYQGDNFHRTDVAGSEAKLMIPEEFGKTNLGAEFRQEGIRSTLLGEMTTDSVLIPGTKGRWYNHRKTRNIFSVYIEQQILMHRFSASGGFLINHTGDYGWKLYGGADFGYKLGNKWRAYGSVNQSLRYPTFTDLYYKGPVNIGNSSLKPEEALTVESGVRWFGKGLYGSAGAYLRQGKNLIDWVKEADTLKWHTMNHTAMTTLGVEASVVLNIREHTGNDQGWMEKIRLSYAYATASKESGVYLSKYVLDYLHHQLTLGVQHLLPGPVEAYWQLAFRDRAGAYTSYPSDDKTPYPPFFLANVRFTYRLKHVFLFLNVSNIFNTSYMNIGNLPMPGRWITGGISVDTRSFTGG